MRRKVLFLAAATLYLSTVWALSSPETIVINTVTTDDPTQIDAQIASGQLLSLHNTFPDLVSISSVPLDGYSSGRLLAIGSDHILALGADTFSQSGLQSMVHADETSVP